MLDGPGGSFLHSEVNQIIHIIVQDQDGQNNNIVMIILIFHDQYTSAIE